MAFQELRVGLSIYVGAGLVMGRPKTGFSNVSEGFGGQKQGGTEWMDGLMV
jgi:hypothetical protein